MHKLTDPPGSNRRAQWSDRERRYIFIHQETGEQIWEYDEVIRRTRGGGYVEQESSSYYDSQNQVGYGGGYGGEERVYENEEVIEERRGGGGGHGMLYGGLGAAAGMAAGAGLMYEGENMRMSCR